MNRPLRNFLRNLTLASLCFGIPTVFVVFGFYAVQWWGMIGFLPVVFACVIAGTAMFTYLEG